MEVKKSKEMLLKLITEQVINELQNNYILEKVNLVPYVPVSISARHIHIQKTHLEKLFGNKYDLNKFKDISQPGQFASKEKVDIIGPRGTIKNVRILGPLREKTQLEISSTDSRQLGLNPPVRSSGQISGSSPFTIVGPEGEITLEEGCIIADRHIHMTPEDAKNYNVKDKQKVSIVVEGKKSGVMSEVGIRVHNDYKLDMHIDTDDANAFALKGNEKLKMIL